MRVTVKHMINIDKLHYWTNKMWKDYEERLNHIGIEEGRYISEVGVMLITETGLDETNSKQWKCSVPGVEIISYREPTKKNIVEIQKELRKRLHAGLYNELRALELKRITYIFELNIIEIDSLVMLGVLEELNKRNYYKMVVN